MRVPQDIPEVVLRRVAECGQVAGHSLPKGLNSSGCPRAALHNEFPLKSGELVPEGSYGSRRTAIARQRTGAQESVARVEAWRWQRREERGKSPSRADATTTS